VSHGFSISKSVDSWSHTRRQVVDIPLIKPEYTEKMKKNMWDDINDDNPEYEQEFSIWDDDWDIADEEYLGWRDFEEFY
jgi:hypothetical protein